MVNINKNSLEFRMNEEYLEDYITGELDRIIKRLKNKYEKIDQEGWPEDYYLTNNVTADYRIASSSTAKAFHSDPTASTAIRLCDNLITLKRSCEEYRTIKGVIANYLEHNDVDRDVLEALKIKIGLSNKTYTELGNESKASIKSLRKKANIIYTQLIRNILNSTGGLDHG